MITAKNIKSNHLQKFTDAAWAMISKADWELVDDSTPSVIVHNEVEQPAMVVAVEQEEVQPKVKRNVRRK